MKTRRPDQAGVDLRAGLPDTSCLARSRCARVANRSRSISSPTARKIHAQGGGCVAVDLMAKGTIAEFTITDTGIGIAKEHMQTVFELFPPSGFEPSQANIEGTGPGGLPSAKGSGRAARRSHLRSRANSRWGPASRCGCPALQARRKFLSRLAAPPLESSPSGRPRTNLANALAHF